MNHCGCGAQLGDDYLHGHRRAVFALRHQSEYAHMVLFRLPLAEPVPIRCAAPVVIGHYPRVAQVFAW
jgi:hypothetical protein